MIRRRYRIEANISTLARFVNVVEKNAPRTASFIQRVTANSTEEYYYVVLIADEAVHTLLKNNRFMDSNALL